MTLCSPVGCAGLVLNPDLESQSEDSEPDGPDEPMIPSPEVDDVKGGSSFQTLDCIKRRMI